MYSWYKWVVSELTDGGYFSAKEYHYSDMVPLDALESTKHPLTRHWDAEIEGTQTVLRLPGLGCTSTIALERILFGALRSVSTEGDNNNTYLVGLLGTSNIYVRFRSECWVHGQDCISDMNCQQHTE